MRKSETECLGWVFLQAGHLPEAAQAYMQGLQQFPRSPWSLTGLKQVWEAASQLQKATQLEQPSHSHPPPTLHVPSPTQPQQQKQQQQPQQQHLAMSNNRQEQDATRRDCTQVGGKELKDEQKGKAFESKTGSRKLLRASSLGEWEGYGLGGTNQKVSSARPHAAEPSTAEPKVAEPNTAEPHAEEPNAAEFNAAGADGAEPKVARPNAAELNAAESTVTEPKAAEPDAAKPSAAEQKAAGADEARNSEEGNGGALENMQRGKGRNRTKNEGGVRGGPSNMLHALIPGIPTAEEVSEFDGFVKADCLGISIPGSHQVPSSPTIPADVQVDALLSELSAESGGMQLAFGWLGHMIMR
eukprot:1139184-Pelagomonas_calceolata.AAC.4